MSILWITGNVDYILTPTDLIFQVGSQQGTLVCTDIDIIDDDVVESSEYFYVDLTTNDTQVQILNFGQRKYVRIYDNDGKRTNPL